MNILPKKRWHVRTKDNIARVRRDEAQAREEELKRQQKLELAESEARINFLRKQSGLPQRQTAEETTNANKNAKIEVTETTEHIDLFADYKSHIKTTNKELEKEKKAEQEKYEKQIGYLTYLGQDTNEALKLRSWYEVAPKRNVSPPKELIKHEKDLKNKYSQDPLTLINALLPPEKKPATNMQVSRKLTSSSFKIDKIDVKLKKVKKEKKHKKAKEHSKDKKKKHKKSKQLKLAMEAAERERKKTQLEQLRKERLKREAAEKARQQALLATADTTMASEQQRAVSQAPSTAPRIKQKYNSQFNPELAKQNMI